MGFQMSERARALNNQLEAFMQLAQTSTPPVGVFAFQGRVVRPLMSYRPVGNRCIMYEHSLYASSGQR